MVGKPNPEAKSKRLVFSPETEEERILSKKAKEQCLKDDYSVSDMLEASGVKPYLRGKGLLDQEEGVEEVIEGLSFNIESHGLAK